MTTASTNPTSNGSTMTANDLLTFTRQELDAETVRQAQALSENNGESLPNSQGVTLDYSKRGITELPVEIIELIHDKVERLALAHNPQISIPMQIATCERLRYLNIRASKLTQFPEHLLSLSQLEILDLSKNEITIIPEAIKSMSSLKFLAIVRNKVTRLPLSLGDMPNLSKLKFEDNPIEFPALEELRLPDDRNGSNMKDIDKDREMCQQVKRVLKSKLLRQRIVSPKLDDEASESNVDTPRPPPRRTVTGRFPVKPSVSHIDLSEVGLRSASNSPPEATQLTAKQSFTSTPTTDRQRSASTSTTASIRSRRQGYVPSKRSNDLGSVRELNLDSVRSSNASTIKAMHAYKASTSSILSGIGSSSGAETSSGPTSPVTEASQPIGRLPGGRGTRHGTTMQAARRLQFSLLQLQRPLHRIASGLANDVPNSSNFARHLTAISSLPEQLDTSLDQLESRMLSPTDQSELQRWIMHLVQSALKSFGYVLDAVHAHIARISFDLDSFYTRTLMYHLYSTTVEARNVLQLLDMPTRHTRGTDTPRALRSTAKGTRSITPLDVKPVVNAKRLRGATILRNEVSNSELRVIPPARSADNSRTSTMTSTFLSSATPSSTDTFPGVPHSAALPPRSNALRSMLQISSSDEHEDATEQFESIYLKLRKACEIASKTLPSCGHEVHAQLDVAQRDGTQALRLWQSALRTHDKVARAYDDLNARLSTMSLQDPVVRSHRDFWQLCDLFVSSWTSFAVDIKKLSSTQSDISTLRSLMKPMQRVIKDLSKLIVDSPLYHQAMKGGSNGAPTSRQLHPPYQLGLNTAQAIAASSVNSGLSSNPASATPTSAHLTVSVPATPLTAALGPAAQATLNGTPGTVPAMADYFSGNGTGTGMLQSRSANLPVNGAFAAVNTSASPQITFSPLPLTLSGLPGRR